MKEKLKLKLFRSSTSQGWTIQLFKVKLDWCERKTDKTPYLIEIDSVKWTGKVPVRTAITDTCEGQVSAALLQWQVLQFLRYELTKWNLSKLLNSNSNCKMNKHAKLRQTNQFTSNSLMIPRCQRSSGKIQTKGSDWADWEKRFGEIQLEKITQNFNNTELQIITQLFNFDLYCTQIIFQLNFAFLILWNLQFKLEKSSFASVFNSYDASP